MTIAALFQQTVTLLRTTSDTRDAIGGASPGTTTSTTVLAYVEPREQPRWGVGEELADRNTLVGDHLLVVPAGTNLIGWDRVTYDGRTFDVIGPPRPFFDPITQLEHHIEVDIRETQ